MELKELQEKLNRKHVKVRVPKIYGESYAVQYARLLKDFTDNVVENFSGLVMAIYEITGRDFNFKAQDVPSLAGAIGGFTSPERRFKIFMDENFNKSLFDEWDEFFKEHEKDITNIERELYGRKKRKSPDESKRAWKELLGIVASEITAKYPKKKKEIIDYTSSLSSLFDYYTGRAELLARDWTDKELNNLYRYVYGSYKSSFPNMSVSGEYYEQSVIAGHYLWKSKRVNKKFKKDKRCK